MSAATQPQLEAPPALTRRQERRLKREGREKALASRLDVAAYFGISEDAVEEVGLKDPETGEWRGIDFDYLRNKRGEAMRIKVFVWADVLEVERQAKERAVKYREKR